MIKNVIILVLSIVLWGCTSTPTTESTGQYIDSAAVTTKVKAQLLNYLGQTALSIKVKTFKDVVQLSGFVDNEFQRRRSGEIASRVYGVREVRNDLVVKH